jgi:hypothetical protein
MFKAFTGSENKASGKTLAQDGSAPPPPVRRAAKVMLAGAGGTIVYGIFWVIVALTYRNTWLKNYESIDHETASQASSGFTAALVFSLVICLAGAAMWWWMARANRAGMGWARWVSSVLFLLWTYVTYQAISGANTAIGLADLIIMLIVWGIGGAAIYQLWLPESTAFIKSTKVVSRVR